MATVGNGRSIIVADDELMVLLADMLEKMEVVEAELIQLRLQGSFPARGARASSADQQREKTPKALRGCLQ